MKGTYSIYISGYDWGCGVSKVLIALDSQLDSISKDDLKVVETKQICHFSKKDYPIEVVEIERQIINVYLCDQSANAVQGSSNYIALELYVSPEMGSPLLFSMKTQFNTWSDPYFLTITKNDNARLTSQGSMVKDFNIDTEFTDKITDADVFKLDHFQSSDHTLYRYAYYDVPSSDTLIVWLHGLGEGGVNQTDPYVTLLANKVTALTSHKFQEIVGKVNILVPQCPTYWMDKDGKQTNLNNGHIIADDNSFYQESLNELILYFQKRCQAKRVILVGCSNGGYMSLLMAIKYPKQYRAIIPICEALKDECITDEQLSSIKDLPMFFIYSKDDPVVLPSLHEIPTIKRLKAMSASPLHVSTFDHVIDTSGKYNDDKGNPYQYNGHWSWIYFDNNEAKCDESHQLVWQWIKEQI